MKDFVESKECKTDTISFTRYERITTKYGRKLAPVSDPLSLINIIDYVIKKLSKFMIHSNQTARDYLLWEQWLNHMSESTVITVDFSENLSLPLNKEPQSLYWARTQVSIHCGVGISNNDSKVYFGHLSEDLKHDQSFILTSLQKMINHFPTTSRYFVRSDNASNYKSAEAFDDMQNLSNENGIMLIIIFGVSGHGKSAVDSCGGHLKTACRQAIAMGEHLR